MSTKQQQEQELNGLRQLMDALSEEFSNGRVDENNDTVIPEESATKIAMLLEQ